MTDEELITSLCARPGMYLGKGTLERVYGFLHGYCLAQDLAQQPENQLVGFLYWLNNEKYNQAFAQEQRLPLDWDWQAHLARLYPNDVDAIAHLLVLFREFQAAAQNKERSFDDYARDVRQRRAARETRKSP